MNKYMVVVRLFNEGCVAIQKDKSVYIKLFDSKDDIRQFMTGHVLEKLPRQIIELEI